MRASRGILVCAAAVIVLGGCAPEPSAPEPEPEALTVTKAGTMYLEAVCPVDEAWDRADVELDRLRLASDPSEVDLSDLAAAMEQVGKASSGADKQLGDKTIAWPDVAGDAIDRVRATLRSDASQAKEVATLSGDEVLDYRWEGADEVAAAAAEARQVLGLPADSGTACALLSSPQQ